MPTKSFNSMHWKLTVKMPQINNTDIDSEYDLNQAKQKLLSELEILLESDVFPMFGRVIVHTAKPELPDQVKHLDLFCGKQYGWTKGFTGYDSTGIDIVEVKNYPGRFIKADLMDYEPKGKYDIITASPPCTEFSIAKKYGWGTQDERQGLDLVHRTLYLIHKLKPKYWIMENVYGLADFIGPPRQKIRYSRHTSSKWAYFWGEFPTIGMLPNMIEHKKNNKVRDPWKRAEIPLSISSTFANTIKESKAALPEK